MHALMEYTDIGTLIDSLIREGTEGSAHITLIDIRSFPVDPYLEYLGYLGIQCSGDIPNLEYTVLLHYETKRLEDPLYISINPFRAMMFPLNGQVELLEDSDLNFGMLTTSEDIKTYMNQAYAKAGDQFLLRLMSTKPFINNLISEGTLQGLKDDFFEWFELAFSKDAQTIYGNSPDSWDRWMFLKNKEKITPYLKVLNNIYCMISEYFSNADFSCYMEADPKRLSISSQNLGIFSTDTIFGKPFLEKYDITLPQEIEEKIIAKKSNPADVLRQAGKTQQIVLYIHQYFLSEINRDKLDLDVNEFIIKSYLGPSDYVQPTNVNDFLKVYYAEKDDSSIEVFGTTHLKLAKELIKTYDINLVLMDPFNAFRDGYYPKNLVTNVPSIELDESQRKALEVIGIQAGWQTDFDGHYSSTFINEYSSNLPILILAQHSSQVPDSILQTCAKRFGAKESLRTPSYWQLPEDFWQDKEVTHLMSTLRKYLL